MTVEWVCLTFGLLAVIVGMAIMSLQKRRRHVNILFRTVFVLLISGYVISLLAMVLEDLI